MSKTNDMNTQKKYNLSFTVFLMKKHNYYQRKLDWNENYYNKTIW